MIYKKALIPVSPAFLLNIFLDHWRETTLIFVIATLNAFLCNILWQKLFFLVYLWNLFIPYWIENRTCRVHSNKFTWSLLFLWIFVSLFSFLWIVHKHHKQPDCLKCISWMKLSPANENLLIMLLIFIQLEQNIIQ